MDSSISSQQQVNQKNINILNNKNIPKSKKKKKNSIYYQCEFDKKTFNNENSYLNHFFSKHPNYKPYYCPVCEKGFNSYSASKHIVIRKIIMEVRNKYIYDN